MKVWHSGGCTYLQGKPDEVQKLEAWVEAAKKYEPSLEIVIDESDEYESSLTVCSRFLKQTERQEAFQLAKKDLKKGV